MKIAGSQGSSYLAEHSAHTSTATFIVVTPGRVGGHSRRLLRAVHDGVESLFTLGGIRRKLL